MLIETGGLYRVARAGWGGSGGRLEVKSKQTIEYWSETGPHCCSNVLKYSLSMAPGGRMENVMKPPPPSKRRSEAACTMCSAAVPERGSQGLPLSLATIGGRKPEEDTWSGAICLQGSMVAAASVRKERRPGCERRREEKGERGTLEQ
jgi:hypothetical protein